MKKKKRQRRKRFKRNGNFESRYLKLCYEFKDFIRCMKAAFYRPHYQKFLMCPLIKRIGQAFVSKHVAESLKRSDELLKHSVELLRHLAELLKDSYELLKYSYELLRV